MRALLVLLGYWTLASLAESPGVARASSEGKAHGPRRLVVVVNSTLSLQTEGSEEWTEVALLATPRKDARKRGSARMMELYHRISESGAYSFISSDPRIGPDAAEGGTGHAVAGWISNEYLIAYETRLAVIWDRESTLENVADGARRTVPGRVFRSPRDAYDSRKQPRSPVFIEQVDEVGESLGFAANTPRMPLLAYPEDEIDHPEIDPLTLNRLMKVAALGAMMPPELGPPTREERRAIDAQRLIIRDRRKRPFQILFVIDDTLSMKAQFPRVARVMREIIQKSKTDPSRAVEIAVAYYNDNDAFYERPGDLQSTGYATQPFVDASSPAAETMTQEVLAHQDRLKGSMDFPEMVSEGLAQAIDKAGFKPQSEGLVFVIGDHGNRGELSYDVLIGKLNRVGGEPIGLVAYQVIDPDRQIDRKHLPEGLNPRALDDPQSAAKVLADYKDAAVAYRDQMRELARRLNSLTAAASRPLGRYERLPDEGANIFEAINLELKAREDVLDRQEARLTARGFPTRVGSELDVILADRGVPIDRLRDLDGVRVGREGFAWQWHRPPTPDEPLGVANLRIQAILSRSEMVALMRSVHPVISASNVSRRLLETIGEAPNATFEGVLLAPQGLPVHAKMFRLARRKLSDELIKAELKPTIERYTRLHSLANQAASPRWFSIGEGSERWCWIDVETELP